MLLLFCEVTGLGGEGFGIDLLGFQQFFEGRFVFFDEFADFLLDLTLGLLPLLLGLFLFGGRLLGRLILRLGSGLGRWVLRFLLGVFLRCLGELLLAVGDVVQLGCHLGLLGSFLDVFAHFAHVGQGRFNVVAGFLGGLFARRFIVRNRDQISLVTCLGDGFAGDVFHLFGLLRKGGGGQFLGGLPERLLGLSRVFMKLFDVAHRFPGNLFVVGDPAFRLVGFILGALECLFGLLQGFLEGAFLISHILFGKGLGAVVEVDDDRITVSDARTFILRGAVVASPQPDREAPDLRLKIEGCQVQGGRSPPDPGFTIARSGHRLRQFDGRFLLVFAHHDDDPAQAEVFRHTEAHREHFGGFEAEFALFRRHQRNHGIGIRNGLNGIARGFQIGESIFIFQVNPPDAF